MEYKFTPEEQKRWNEIIVGCFKEFIRICEANDLRYFCAAGTAIGTVRHQGMIPWDDDIDVAMPRPDYDRFISICKSNDLGDFELADPDMKDYPIFYAKFCDKRTTLIEEENVPCKYGLFIDIFPIDGAGNDIEEAKRLKDLQKRWCNKLNATLARLSVGEYLSLALKPREWGRMAFQTLSFIVGRETVRKWLIKKINKINATYDYDSSALVVSYPGAYRYREIFPKEWIEPLSKHTFEGLSVNLPQDYDAYLRNMYGDYMQLPPIEKRVSHHYHSLVDLYKRI